jgi:hypothetical protein
LLCSAKSPSLARLPPIPGDIHVATHRELASTQLEALRVGCAYGRRPEHSPGSVPEFQVPMPNGVLHASGGATGLATCLGTMADSSDLGSVLSRMDKEHPIVSSAKPHFFQALRTFQIPGTGFGEPMKGGKNPHVRGPIKRANIGSGLIRPNDSSRFSIAIDIGLGNAGFGEDLLVRDWFVVITK